MRRGVSEWLVVPLFLLPVLLAAGFCLLARRAYREETRPYREDGARLAREWLEADPDRAAWLVRRFVESRSPSGVPVRIDGAPYQVRIPADALPPEPWVFTRHLPSGLTSAGLRSAKVRLEIETGTPPVGTEGADPGAAALRDLLVHPDRERLRLAPLPPGMKRLVLERGDPDPWAGAAGRLLDVVTALVDLRTADLADLPPGAHRVGGLSVLVSDGAWPIQVLPPGAEADSAWARTVAENSSGTVRLVYDPPAGADAAWSGRLAGPPAGRYAFVLPAGDRWWVGPLFLRWAGPVGGVCLLSLLLPAALFVSLRRRRRLDAARARFINELAHDLRTPLTSLRLYAEMLAAGKAPEGDREQYVATIARESGRLSALLANLLDLSRLERGTRELAPETIEVDDVVGEALRDFSALHPDRADDVRVSGPDGVTALADRTALARCLGNLLDNAGKFTPPGTPIRISFARPADGKVRIVVADEGPGIPVGERRRVFRRYERGQSAKRDGVPGTGLGLSLVAELAAAMGGAAALQPSEKGARFEIALPGGGDG